MTKFLSIAALSIFALSAPLAAQTNDHMASGDKMAAGDHMASGDHMKSGTMAHGKMTHGKMVHHKSGKMTHKGAMAH